MKKKIRDFTAEERDKICNYYKLQNEKCKGCPLNSLCQYNMFRALGFGTYNPNFDVIEVDDEILK